MGSVALTIVSIAQSPTADPPSDLGRTAAAVVLLLATICAWPVSSFLLGRYRRAVVAAMRSSGSDASAVARSLRPTGRAVSEPPPPPLEVRHLDRTAVTSTAAAAMFARRWRAATAYAVAGVAMATVLALALLGSMEGPIGARRLAALVGVFLWPTALIVALVAATTTRASWTIVAVYALGLVALLLVTPGAGPGLLTVWAVYMGPATVMLGLFLTRRLRAVGPLVLTTLVCAWSGAVAISGVLEQSSDAVLYRLVAVGLGLGLGGRAVFYVTLLGGAIVLSAVGWQLLRWIARRYDARAVSDELIHASSMAVLFAASASILFAGAAWAVVTAAAVATWWLVVHAGFVALTRTPRPAPAPRLLLLRVFALGGSAERLFTALRGVWLRHGAMVMIAGPDLATSSVEPHEFLEFLRGRTRQQFIARPDDLERRLSEIDDGATPDGRYRVHELFCFDDTWRLALERLARLSDVVLMDLRAFSPARRGCIWELTHLIDAVPLDRVLLVVDDTTDAAFLEKTLHEIWAQAAPDSPNLHRERARISIFRCRGSAEHDLRPMLASLLGAVGATA